MDRKGKRKRGLALLLALTVGACPLAVSAATGSETAEDGNWTGAAHVEARDDARNLGVVAEYDITVGLTVEDGLFQDISLTAAKGYKDFNDYYLKQTALVKFEAAVLGKPATEDTVNSWTEPDGVTGATYSSRAIREAAREAVRSAPAHTEVDPALTAFESGKPVISSVKAASSTQVKVSWKHFENADSYNVFRKAEGGKWETLKVGVKALAYADTKAKEGVTYSYGVQAVNSSKWGSKVASAYASKPVTTPLLSVGKAEISKVASTDYNKLKITWKKVTNATGYIVSRSTSKNGKYKTVKTVSKGTTVSYTDPSLTTGKTYYYKVKAIRKVNGKTVKGTDSACKGGKPALRKPALTLKAGKKSAVLKWKKVSGANGYEIRRAASKNGSYKVVTTIKKGGTVSYTNKKLTSKKTYYYKVRAYRTVSGKKVYSPWSAVQKVKAR